jgi:exonuclease-1
MGAGGGFYPKLEGLAKAVVLRQEYCGRTLGVDASMWMHRHMFRFFREYMEDGDTWQIAEEIKREVARAASQGIRLKRFFDGKPCPNKAGEDARGKERRDAALAQYHSTQDPKLLRQAIGRSWALTRAVIEAVRSAGAPFVVAPYEADSQLAYEFHKGIIYAVVGDDADFLCMGCRVVRHFDARKGTGTEYDLSRAAAHSRSGLEKLVAQHGQLALRVFSNLVGNDYSAVLPKGQGGAAAVRLMEQVGVESTAVLSGFVEHHHEFQHGLYIWKLVYTCTRCNLTFEVRVRSPTQYTNFHISFE